MILEDFYKLHVRQAIYFNGEKVEIDTLKDVHGNVASIAFRHTSAEPFKSVMGELSFDPPKEKKRYWRWRLCTTTGAWFSPAPYLDDKGIDTSGCAYSRRWDEWGKQKIENDFVED